MPFFSTNLDTHQELGTIDEIKCLNIKGSFPEISKVGPKWVVNFQAKKLNNAKNHQKI
jgi:hypothetical protein